MTTPYDWFAKINTNYYGHMTKKATTPIYGKTLLISSSLEPNGQWLWDLVCCIGNLGPTRFSQMMILGWPWPTLWQGTWPVEESTSFLTALEQKCWLDSMKLCWVNFLELHYDIVLFSSHCVPFKVSSWNTLP